MTDAIVLDRPLNLEPGKIHVLHETWRIIKGLPRYIVAKIKEFLADEKKKRIAAKEQKAEQKEARKKSWLNFKANVVQKIKSFADKIETIGQKDKAEEAEEEAELPGIPREEPDEAVEPTPGQEPKQPEEPAPQADEPLETVPADEQPTDAPEPTEDPEMDGTDLVDEAQAGYYNYLNERELVGTLHTKIKKELSKGENANFEMIDVLRGRLRVATINAENALEQYIHSMKAKKEDKTKEEIAPVDPKVEAPATDVAPVEPQVAEDTKTVAAAPGVPVENPKEKPLQVIHINPKRFAEKRGKKVAMGDENAICILRSAIKSNTIEAQKLGLEAGRKMLEEMKKAQEIVPVAEMQESAPGIKM